MYNSYTFFLLVFVFLVLWTCHFLMSYFLLWNMSSELEVFIRFVDGASWHTRRLSSAAWVIFTPQGQLLSLGGICLGDSKNNVVE
jgi:hypothetical protein